jgi:hypothetical protein
VNIRFFHAGLICLSVPAPQLRLQYSDPRGGLIPDRLPAKKPGQPACGFLFLAVLV